MRILVTELQSSSVDNRSVAERETEYLYCVLCKIVIFEYIRALPEITELCCYELQLTKQKQVSSATSITRFPDAFSAIFHSGIKVDHFVYCI